MTNLIAIKEQSMSERWRVGMAPMDGITDFSFRLWLRAIGKIDFFITPFLRITNGFTFASVEELFVPEIFALKNLFSEPVIPQLMGENPQDIIRVGEKFLEYADYIDLNCACPAKIVVKHGAGSALLKDISVFKKFLTTINDNLGNKKYSIKIRSGFCNSDGFKDILEVINKVNPINVTLHPRTQAQGYTGSADWNLVENAAAFLGCSVIGSGDIIDNTSFENAQKNAPHAKGAIIGRGMLKNPWIFLELQQKKSGIFNNDAINDHELYYWSIATYALIRYAQYLPKPAFFKLTENIVLKHFPCGYNVESWKKLYFYMSDELWKKSVEPSLMPAHPIILNKIKQLAKYSIEERPFYLPSSLLKTENLCDFFIKLAALKKICFFSGKTSR